jgi:hypothetical protein
MKMTQYNVRRNLIIRNKGDRELQNSHIKIDYLKIMR